jgi:hypothetical protein
VRLARVVMFGRVIALYRSEDFWVFHLDRKGLLVGLLWYDLLLLWSGGWDA